MRDATLTYVKARRDHHVVSVAVIVTAWIGTAFAETDPDAARTQWRKVADQARPRVPKLATLMDEAEDDEWAVQRRYMTLEALAAVGDAVLVSLPAVAV